MLWGYVNDDDDDASGGGGGGINGGGADVHDHDGRGDHSSDRVHEHGVEVDELDHKPADGDHHYRHRRQDQLAAVSLLYHHHHLHHGHQDHRRVSDATLHGTNPWSDPGPAYPMEDAHQQRVKTIQRNPHRRDPLPT